MLLTINPKIRDSKIIVSFDVELFNNVNKVINLNDFLKSDELDLLNTPQINSKDKLIEKIAKDLKIKNDIDTLANIAYFTSKAINYKNVDKNYSAIYALKNNIGDCKESSYIFASLARSLNYPTKLMTGYCLDRSISYVECILYKGIWMDRI